MISVFLALLFVTLPAGTNTVDTTGYFFAPGLTQQFNGVGLLRIDGPVTEVRDGAGNVIPPTQGILYGIDATSGVLEVDSSGPVTVTMAADVNGDLTVDIGDVTTIAIDRVMGGVPSVPASDTNGDGVVDATDLMNSYFNFGNVF